MVDCCVAVVVFCVALGLMVVVCWRVVLTLWVLFCRPVTGWKVLVLVEVLPWRGLGERSAVGSVERLLPVVVLLPVPVDVPEEVVLRRCCEPKVLVLVEVEVLVFLPALFHMSLSDCPWSLGRCCPKSEMPCEWFCVPGRCP